MFFSDFDAVTEKLINDLWSIEPFPILLVTFNDYEVYSMGFKMKMLKRKFFDLEGKESHNSTGSLNKLK